MAVDNFVAFKRLMVKRNGELNVQAQAMMASADAANDQALTTDKSTTDKDREDIKEAYRVS